jgi:glycerol-3-phosphate O-acyltransferase
MISSIKKNWVRSSTKLRGWLDRMICGTHDHYLWQLPGNNGRFSAAILKLYFSGIKVHKDQLSAIRNIEEDGIVVYASKYKSRFDFLFFHSRFREIGLPYPETGFELRIWFWQPLSRFFRILVAHLDHFIRHLSFPDPYERGFIREELLKGRSALLFLVERRGFIRRFIKAETDPLRYLIEMQKSMARPIYIVLPVIFFGRKPHRSQPTLIDILFGTEEKPRRIRRFFTLFKKPEKVFVEISEPVNLRDYLDREENHGRNAEHLALTLRRQLILQINRHRQSITGPLLKSREELKESILTGDRLRSFMDQYAKSHDTPISKVRKSADDYLEEMAANYKPGLIRFCSVVVKWIMSLMFEGISVNADVLTRVRQMSQRAPLILIPCHKSHIDYLVLSYVLYNNNMPCPHVAAGKNLSFWPLGAIFRGTGAFFLRRSFRGAVLYSKVFTEYIHNLLEEGFNIEFFIEGGRSRTGKLMSPKIGLLSILLNAYRNGACEDMIIAPIFIGYDKVLEESSYLHEIEGGRRNRKVSSRS